MSVFRACALLCFGALLGGCGLPDQYYLAPPVAPIKAIATSNYFQFNNPDHSIDLNVVFKGFDLYYKFYADTSVIEDLAYDSTSPLDAASQLKAKGFFELCARTDTPPNRSFPVVPISAMVRADSFTVYVNINQPTAGTSFSTTSNLVSYYTYSPPSGSLVETEIRRFVADPSATGAYKTFLPNQWVGNNYSSSPPDPDIASPVLSSILGTGGGNAYVALYAVSYGVIGVSTPSRSAAEYLGYIRTYIGP
jgi:hypothetical protein